MTKYRAIPTTVDNIRFASKKEAARYTELKLLFRAGKIQTLELQPEFKLHSYGDGTYIGTYRADFAYFDGQRRIVEDVKPILRSGKPYMPALSKWKIKHAEAEYKIKVLIV